MKTVALFDTSIASLNMGDEIINLSIKKNWAELFLDNYILRMPTHTPLFYWWQNLYSGGSPAYCNVDYKIICGTNLLYTDMLRPKPSWNIYRWNSKLVTGSVLLGVGQGKNSDKVTRYTRKLYDKVLNHDLIHSVRDNRTAEILDKLGFKVFNTGCPTLWGLDARHCASIPDQKADRAVVTLTCYQADVKRDSAMVRAVMESYPSVFFWPQTYDDLEYFKTLGFSNVALVPPNVRGFDALLSEGNIDYIGNRLHGGIFALQHACRTIIIGIDYRAAGMNESFSIPYLPREDVSDLCSQINSTWKTEITGLDYAQIERWKSQFGF